MVGVVIQVFGRYVFHTSTPWSEELAVYSFIWMVLLGSAVGVREHSHLVADLLPETINPTIDRLLPTLTYAVTAVFVVYGWDYAMLGRTRVSDTVGFPMVYLYLAVPVSGAAMALFLIERVGITWLAWPSDAATGHPETREA